LWAVANRTGRVGKQAHCSGVLCFFDEAMLAFDEGIVQQIKVFLAEK